ncbi:hypothetical protein CGRA01v4_03485 [Colletotrichum graminicola]|nr:hypothetical protein CGRA01v4_03485 [Colletotrichum graminicola]
MALIQQCRRHPSARNRLWGLPHHAYTITKFCTGSPSEFKDHSHPPGFVETTVYCKPCVWKNIPILCSIPAPTANVDINGNGVTAGAYGGYGSYDQVAPAQPGQPGAPGTAGAPGGAPALTLLGHQRSPPPPYRLSRGASVSFAVLDHHQLCYAFGGIREQLVSLGWHG